MPNGFDKECFVPTYLFSRGTLKAALRVAIRSQIILIIILSQTKLELT